MENEIYYYSFVCSNETPKSVLQIILYEFKKENNIISLIPEANNSYTEETKPALIKLSETIKILEVSYPSKPITVAGRLEVLFAKRWVEAKENGYLNEFLDFHFNEYLGEKENFIEHLRKKKYPKWVPIWVWIEKAANSLKNEPVRDFRTKQKKGNELDRIEKMLIIHLLQDQGLFPKSTQFSTQKSIDELISKLTEISTPDEVKKLRLDQINAIIRGKLSSGQINAKLKNLNNIRPFIENLSNDGLTKSLNDLVIKVENSKSR